MDAMRIGLDDGRLRLTDTVRRESSRFGLPAGATLRDGAADAGDLPVEAAVVVRTDRVDVPLGTGVGVRDADGSPRDYFDRAAAAYDAGTAADLRVSTARGVSRDGLAGLLGAGTDVFHFVGHATPAGLECPDGTLDLGTVDHGVDAFVLNACQSYRQGVRLVEGGAVALSDVANDDAVDVGLLLARLLNAGFPFRVATRIARRLSVVGGQYVVVGDGDLTLSQPEGFAPLVVVVRDRDDGRYGLRLRPSPTPLFGFGSHLSPAVDSVPEQFLNAGESPEFVVGAGELADLLDIAPIPVEYEGELVWSDDLRPL